MDVKSKRSASDQRLSSQPIRRGHDRKIFIIFGKGSNSKGLTANDLEKYLCWVLECRRVLRNPYMAECGHRFCQGCLDGVLKTKGYLPCEGCRLDGTPGVNITGGYPDMAMRRELGRLACACPNQGCDWTGMLKEYEGQHEDQCQFGNSVCDLCEKNIATGQLSEHRESCPAALIQCPHCHVSLEQRKLQYHIRDSCPKVPLTCQCCGRSNILRGDMLAHVDLDTGDCSAPRNFCPLGCNQIINPKSVKHHCQTNIGEHVVVLQDQLNSVASQEPGSSSINSPETSLRGQMTALSERIATLERECQDFKDKATAVSTRADQIQNSSSNEAVAGNLNSSLDISSRKLAMGHGFMHIFAKDIERMEREMKAYDRLSKTERDKIRNSSSKLTTLEKKLNDTTATLEDYSSRILSLETGSADGTFVWKITGFARCRHDAVNGSRPHLMSPSFTTGRQGYRLRLKMFPDGEGTCKGTHISLFLVVVKGDYDAILPWPFQQTVKLMIMDLGRERKHVSYPFRPPTEQTASFKRPVSEMNIPSGCPTMLSLVDLEDNRRGQFVVKDEMYVKVIVNVTGLEV